MREILFRGKRRDTGEWVEGYLVYCKSEFDDERVAEIIPQETDRIYRGEYDLYDVHEVDPETVGQFTGLTDKNGKRIFEGDIIQTKRKGYKGEKTYRFVVKYGEYIPKHYCREKYSEYNTIGFYCDSNTGHYQLSACSNRVEVIGNIHDNPELIGEREDNE